ncbi:MAG: TetR/AcrR family transcriptional regulator [Rhizorhabdus sp.]
MRKDAEGHRALLVTAATAVFAANGCGAPLEQVLTAAGLGRGTLYRHFPTREALILAVLTSELDRMAVFVDERKDSRSLLRDFLGQNAAVASMAISAMQALGESKTIELLKPLSRKAKRLYQTVADRALVTGEARPPFGEQDLKLILRMIVAAGSQETNVKDRARMVARGLDITLAGLAAL